jgi:hypothetical protein
MTFLALWSLLRKVPVIVWAFAFVALLALAASAFTYASGRQAGERRVHREALQDSVDQAYQHLEAKTVEVERARKLASTVKRWTDSSRVTRQELRANVESLLDSLPEPVVQLIRHDDKQIRRDSVTITAFVAADSAWVSERHARIRADTLESHQIDVGRPEGPRRFRALATWGAVALAVVGGALVYSAVR